MAKAHILGRLDEYKVRDQLTDFNIKAVRVDRRAGQLGEEKSCDFKITFPNGAKTEGENKRIKGGLKRPRSWLKSADILFVSEPRKETLVVMTIETLGKIAGGSVK